MGGPTGTNSSRGIIKQPAGIDRWPRGITYKNGFRILGTPLGFRNVKTSGLRFISKLDEAPPSRGDRVLTSRFLADVMGLDKRGVDTLVLEYGQQIRLGRMGIRLYPAGLGLGSAQLEISFKERRILYCGGVNTAQPICSPPCEIPECDLLLLDVVSADPKPPAPAKAVKQLLTWIKQIKRNRRIPLLACGSQTAALDAAWALAEIGVSVLAQRRLFDLFRRTAALGSRVPKTKQLRQTLLSADVVLHVADQWSRSKFFGSPELTPAYVGPGRVGPDFAEAHFRLGEEADRTALVNYVRSTRATQVALGSQCDEALVKLLQKTGLRTYRVVHFEQMPLPF